jgi:hypothetical protein
MTDTMTSQNIDLSSLDTTYKVWKLLHYGKVTLVLN